MQGSRYLTCDIYVQGVSERAGSGHLLLTNNTNPKSFKTPRIDCLTLVPCYDIL